MFGLIQRSNNPGYFYNPFREMEEMERRFFGSAMDDFFRAGSVAEFKTDVTDEGDHYLLEADLPGFDKADIHLDLEGDVLTICAERRRKVTQKDQDKVVRMERSYGSYSRRYDVSNINAEAIQAKYENGVLQLTLPKKEELPSAARHIEIQ